MAGSARGGGAVRRGSIVERDSRAGTRGSGEGDEGTSHYTVSVRGITRRASRGHQGRDWSVSVGEVSASDESNSGTE